MKLCIIVLNSLRKDPRVVKQVKCALDQGIDVYFIGVRDIYFSKKFLNELGCNVSIVDLGEDYVGPLKSFFKKMFRKVMFFYMPIRMMVKIKPDVIHSNDFNTLIQAYIASRICKCKILYDAHEIDAENLFISEKKIQKRIIITLERLLVRRVDAMVSVSNAAAKYFSKKYRIPIPVVITNCPYRSGIVMQETKDMSKFEVLYQGLLLEGRGYEEFVKSAKHLISHTILVIRGYGPIEGSLKEIIREEHLENKVRFDSPVEIIEIIPKSSESHLGVVLTQPININFELTVSNKLFEYIQAGLPVLMSNIPEHKDLNGKFNFGIIVDDCSPKGIAKCINELALDHEKYNLLRNNAIETAKVMCWENESKKLISLYFDLYARN